MPNKDHVIAEFTEELWNEIKSVHSDCWKMYAIALSANDYNTIKESIARGDDKIEVEPIQGGDHILDAAVVREALEQMYYIAVILSIVPVGNLTKAVIDGVISTFPNPPQDLFKAKSDKLYDAIRKLKGK